MSANARRCLTIVLAAGEGVRMRSARPKVLHELAGRSMLAHVLSTVREGATGDIAVVVGPNGDGVAAEALKAAPEAKIAVQHERRGTADAVLAARDQIERGYDDILVLYADTPLIEASTLAAMRAELASGVEVVALGFEAADPTGYGRLVERNGRLIAIREHKDASAEERASRLCNAGPIAFSGAEALSLLTAVKPTTLRTNITSPTSSKSPMLGASRLGRCSRRKRRSWASTTGRSSPPPRRRCRIGCAGAPWPRARR